MDLTYILRDCKGKKFYCTLLGDVKIIDIIPGDKLICRALKTNTVLDYDKTGSIINSSIGSTLIPSKECNDWLVWIAKNTVDFKIGMGVIDKSSNDRYQITSTKQCGCNIYLVLSNIQEDTSIMYIADELQSLVMKDRIEIFDKVQDILKPFDKVIVKENGHYYIDLYAKKVKDKHMCMNHLSVDNVLPYFPNEHLVD